MTDFQRDILGLVKSALTDEKTDISADFDWDALYRLASKHQIIPLVYYGAKASGIRFPDDVKSKFDTAVYTLTIASVKQLYELKRVTDAFENNGIEYMLLKGAALKLLYPRPEMRQMSDADILIKTEQYDKIKPIMLELGFCEGVESDHEFCWKKDGALYLELHKRLIPSYNKDYYAYFGDGWRLAKPTDSSKYALSDEDNFIYLFTHYAKHYRDGGIGVRHLIDFKVLIDSKPEMDIAYIENELKLLQLFEFYNNSMKTLSVWFENGAEAEAADIITQKIFSSGAYGQYNDHIISAAVKTSKSSKNVKEVKLKKFIRLVFPDINGLSLRYPVLKKCGILLPIFWVVRWLETVIKKPQKLRKEKESLKLLTDENITKYQKELNLVGLDFNFEE